MIRDKQGFRSILLLMVAVFAVSLGGCTWQPKMFHPHAFDSGRTLPQGDVEIALQTFGAGISYGFGAGFEGRLAAALDGEEIGGVELALARTLRTRENAFASGMIGLEWFDASSPDFSGFRFVTGLTGSVYTQNRRFGLHLPLKVYYMSYNYEGYYIEGLHIGESYVHVDDQDEGGVFVPGIGLSVEGEHVSFRAAGNLPMREYIGKVEMLPFVGFRLGVKF
ncbi:MAG: hypothetical protein GY867_09295 [bacterium]|nr:hypothetical protein [bacterium]